MRDSSQKCGGYLSLKAQSSHVTEMSSNRFLSDFATITKIGYSRSLTSQGHQRIQEYFKQKFYNSETGIIYCVDTEDRVLLH